MILLPPAFAGLEAFGIYLFVLIWVTLSGLVLIRFGCLIGLLLSLTLVIGAASLLSFVVVAALMLGYFALLLHGAYS